MNYIGEHYLPGMLGNFFVVFAFAACMISCVSYFLSTRKNVESENWLHLARLSFRLHSVALIGIFVSLFYIIYNHYFEYHYAWAHSSTTLPTRYMISCFWEGQEGSFLLWAFWQGVLGNILIFTARSWEKEVLGIVSLSQVLILSMLLGVEILGQHVGSSPFILLRKALAAPIFQRADYLSFIKDGNGLNPLLQNYWMVIHPPTLFFGFASMVVPFAFAIAGLLQKRYDEWIKAALPWALLGVMILGTGIIMGSFWAYEALNFGGFWAWDPVENASMIPWLTLIGAVHVMMAYRSSGHAYFTALFLTIISFILVLYASFLTRSGILGETSVHAFTDLGMSGQLIIYIAVFLIISLFLVIKNWKHLPISKKDEATYSREFWLFIGALVLAISCFQIIITTSIPVVNAIFGTKIAPPLSPVQHYNQWQTPMAVLVLLIAGFSQFMKYKNTEPSRFYISILVSVIASGIIAAPIIYFGNFYKNPVFILLIFAAVFSIISNGKILNEAVRGKWKLAGSAIAHIGFAMMLMGALIAASSSSVISVNRSGISYGKDFDEKNTRENILLWKNEPIRMDQYQVTYLGDTSIGINIFYKVNYKTLDVNGKIKENFTLMPNAQINPKMGLVASPDTRHYLLKDIYTHVSSVPNREDEKSHQENQYKESILHQVKLGESFRQGAYTIQIDSIKKDPELKDIHLTETDLAVAAQLSIIDSFKTYHVSPVFIIKNGMQYSFPAYLKEAGLKLEFTGVNPQQHSFSISISELKEKPKDFIIMKAIVFPYINLLWTGTIVMVIGFLLSIIRRIKDNKRTKLTSEMGEKTLNA